MMLTCKSCGHTGIPATSKNGPHISAYCMECGLFQKHLSQSSVEDDFILYFGKYKGRSVKSMVGNNTEEFQYLRWLLNQDYIKLKNNHILILKNLTK